ncbi:hypothetical protein AB0M02_38880 [Actinoplanes sp. NPDC051861]|uniref:hypothetical protein n=1 Tax=Actinoplanes sp. NPDC051861 TaxID=3155170 RepID=UPI0034259DB9
MNFFDRFPPPRTPEPAPAHTRPRWMKPETTLGAAVPAEVLLARSETTAVGLGGIIAYPNGFCLTLTMLMREEDRRGRLFHLAFHPELLDEESPGPEFLRLGVQFADGSAAANFGDHPFDSPSGFPSDFPSDFPEEERTGPILTRDGGGGGGRRYDMSYWVWPLPPAGPVTFVCQWPAHGITEATAEVDGQLIRDAAARAVELWPTEG